MTGDARPVCPTCGAPLFARSHGDMTCVTHGHFVPAQTLDATFGAGSSQRVRQATAKASMTPRKCPDDRYEMSTLASPSGAIHADACARCGGLWINMENIEAAQRQTPLGKDVPMSEARSLYALACARALCAPPAQVRR